MSTDNIESSKGADLKEEVAHLDAQNRSTDVVLETRYAGMSFGRETTNAQVWGESRSPKSFGGLCSSA